jgi:hypothetical protein
MISSVLLRAAVAILTVLVSLSPPKVPSAEAGPRRLHVAAAVTLERVNQDFLEAVRTRNRERIASFFPTTDDFTHTVTEHGRNGREITVWRFPASEVRDAIWDERVGGPFDYNYERMRPGALSTWVTHSGTRWHRVPENRFVPPRAPVESGAYVQWRREGMRWVVIEIGDDSFDYDAPIPAWIPVPS